MGLGVSDHFEARQVLLPAASAVRRDGAKTQLSFTSDNLAAEPRTSVPELIANHARRIPAAIAVTTGDEAITFGELDARSGILAAQLRSMGIKRDVVVAVCLHRSLAFVVAALGVMKAGGAYLPLDNSQALDRLLFQFADAGAQFLITSDGTDVGIPCEPSRVIHLTPDGALRVSIRPEQELVPVDICLEDLAYVIYTSGSTGRPKGVEIEHRSLSNLSVWHREAFQITASDRASQVSRLEFDAAVWELWPNLAAGASVHLPDESVIHSPVFLRDWLVAQEITVAFVPSPLADRLITMEWPVNSRLRILLTGADVLHRYPPASLPFQVVNNYGPTECTVVATSACLLPAAYPDHPPPIGKPIPGVQIHLLDENRQPVPPGHVAEICIAGQGLARGYRNDPELTEKKFARIPCPSASGARMYFTGDLGFFLPDGQIAFFGRADNQIKLRGIRIEPAEIEVALNSHPRVLESAVASHSVLPGDERLVAFLVSDSGHAPATNDIRSFLASKLPEYMIPSAFVQLPRLPLTAARKVDRTALQQFECQINPGTNRFVPATTAIERLLVEILAPLLEQYDIGVDDNFFMLGGHSLLGTQFIARIRDRFGVDVSLRFLFESPTIAAIASEVERLRRQCESMNQDAAPRRIVSGLEDGRGGI
jgi:amino acid adenylation domain-containing protein